MKWWDNIRDVFKYMLDEVLILFVIIVITVGILVAFLWTKS